MENKRNKSNVPAAVSSNDLATVDVQSSELENPNTKLEIRRDASPQETPRVSHVQDDESVDDHLGGGYATVKGKKRVDSSTWRVVIIMSIICVIIAACSSILTAILMRRGIKPDGIIQGDGKVQQAVAAVVSARKSSVVVVKGNGTAGSGIVMDYKNGDIYIMTNYHVINGSSSPTVQFSEEEGYSYPATVVGYSTDADVAVIKSKRALATVKTLYGSEYFSADTTFREGDYVVAIGNSSNYGIACYDGIISRASEVIYHDQKAAAVTRTTAAINAGMSGGGVFDMSGNLIGMGTYRLATTGDGTNANDDVEDTGFFIPNSILFPLYVQITEHGVGGEVQVPKVTLFKNTNISIGGVTFNSFGFTARYEGKSLNVTSLDAGTPSDKVTVGDKIVKINSDEVTTNICNTIGSLMRCVRNGAPGPQLSFTVERSGAEQVVYMDGYYRTVS